MRAFQIFWRKFITDLNNDLQFSFKNSLGYTEFLKRQHYNVTMTKKVTSTYIWDRPQRVPSCSSLLEAQAFNVDLSRLGLA